MRNEQSAIFWAVFGKGMTLPDAEKAVKDASNETVARWARRGSESFRKFDEIITAMCKGDDTLLNQYSYVMKHPWYVRLWKYLWRKDQ